MGGVEAKEFGGGEEPPDLVFFFQRKRFFFFFFWGGATSGFLGFFSCFFFPIKTGLSEGKKIGRKNTKGRENNRWRHS